MVHSAFSHFIFLLVKKCYTSTWIIMFHHPRGIRLNYPFSGNPTLLSGTILHPKIFLPTSTHVKPPGWYQDNALPTRSKSSQEISQQNALWFTPPQKKKKLYMYIQNKARFVHLKQNLGMFFLKRTWAGTVGLWLLFYYLTMLRYEYEPLGTNLKNCTHTHTTSKKTLLQDVEVKCCILEGQLLLNATSLLLHQLQVCHAKCSAGYVHPL